jgi:hypothetical protein
MVSFLLGEEVIKMFAGKDEQKAHLHYASHVRFVADRLVMLTGIEQRDVLEIITTIGMLALLDEMVEHLNGHVVDGMKAAKLLSTKAYFEREYQERRVGFIAKCEAMDLALLKRE